VLYVPRREEWIALGFWGVSNFFNGGSNMTGARKLGISVAAALVVGVTGFAALRTAAATGPEVTVYRSPT